MSKITYIFLLLLISLSFTSYSQVTSAKRLVEEVRSHYNSDYAFQSDFTIEINIPEADKTIMDGTLYIKGDQFKFIAPEMTIISDNINMWYWTKTDDIDEVQISYVEESEEIIQPSDVFNLYLKGFAYKLVSEIVDNGRNLALIELVPIKRDDLNPYFKVKTVVDTDKDSIDQLQVYYKDGTVYTYRVKNESEATFAADFFTFDETENSSTEIIDLR